MRGRVWAIAATAAALVCSAGCATTRPTSATARSGAVIEVGASISAWGSIVAQLGGAHVHETSIIANPDTDPHDYEPTPADARVIADSRLFVENGLGYDGWAARALAASPDSSRAVINVGDVVGLSAGANPHRWYSPTDVNAVALAITAALTRIDPRDAAYFAQQHRVFTTVGLAEYHRLIAAIKARYAGTPIGASESVVSPLAEALGLTVVTPARFLAAISEGADPSAADKTEIDRQINHHEIRVYVFNAQNSTPDVQAQVSAAHRRGIPVVAVTESLTPATVTFQQWQVTQLMALLTALEQGVTP